MHTALEKFIALYSQDLAGKDMAIIGDVYSNDIEFIDPAHRVKGIAELTHYFNNTMANVTECRFDIHSINEQAQGAFVTWTMYCAHPKLNKGKTFAVEGVSDLRFADKITYHRDYFDLGAMLYEQVPLLGGIVRKVKHALTP
jgi:limonene-1,2-epoxide hydrolase